MIFITQLIYIKEGQEIVFHQFEDIEERKKFLHLKAQSVKSVLLIKGTKLCLTTKRRQQQLRVAASIRCCKAGEALLQSSANH